MRQRRSYGNTVSLASLEKYFCVKTRFSKTVTIVATGAMIWKPGFTGLAGTGSGRISETGSVKVPKLWLKVVSISTNRFVSSLY